MIFDFLKKPKRMAPEPLLPTPDLSWDNKPELKKYSHFLYTLSTKLVPLFDKTKDVTTLRKDWHQLNERNKLRIIAETIIAIARFESNFNITKEYYSEQNKMHTVGLTGQVPEVMVNISLPFTKEELLTVKPNLVAAVRVLEMALTSKKKFFVETRPEAYWACFARTHEQSSELVRIINNV